MDYARAGIWGNAFAPGLAETAMTWAWLDDLAKRGLVPAGPQLQRVARPEELVVMVLYLASPLSSFVTDGIYVVDGGQTTR
ncbi:SDR family oxidoreductase [Streptomyces sp. NPDC018352]|uniref:SDR family oxidoreductase n=1 Tax=Streptomyces sp. NPDC018352 TaxID=3157194 RepID=UPI0033D6BEF6